MRRCRAGERWNVAALVGIAQRGQCHRASCASVSFVTLCVLPYALGTASSSVTVGWSLSSGPRVQCLLSNQGEARVSRSVSRSKICFFSLPLLFLDSLSLCLAMYPNLALNLLFNSGWPGARGPLASASWIWDYRLVRPYLASFLVPVL